MFAGLIAVQSPPERLVSITDSGLFAPAPVPGFLEPMKAKLVNSILPGDWIYEVKFDGYRALALRGGAETRLLSRNQKDLGKKFPEILDAIASLDLQDGEEFSDKLVRQ